MATKHRSTRSAANTKKAAKTPARAPKPARPASVKRPAGRARTPAKAKAGARPARPANGKARAIVPAKRQGAPRPDGRLATAGTVQVRSLTAPEPTGPSSHDLAVEVFERGFRALQTRNFKEAAKTLASIIDAYPDEKELHERARVYIAICERQSDPKRELAPRTAEERVNAATVAINRGAFADALEFLHAVAREDDENDLVHYMMAVAHAGLGDCASAIPHLHQAIELNPENRFLAAQDTDLDPIRQHGDFVALLDSPPPPRRRPVPRVRQGR
jgi:tetratricopeptide (TPR) repeat protein